MIAYNSEKVLYQPVADWLLRTMRTRFKGSYVRTFITSNMRLSKLIEVHGWQSMVPFWDAYDIEVDVVGALIAKKHIAFVLVEVKRNKATLRDLGQILGYCQVAKAIGGVLISPLGANSYLTKLVRVYNRLDVLQYSLNGKLRNVSIARWIPDREDIDYSTVMPSSSLFR